MLLVQAIVAAAWKFTTRGVQLSKEVGAIVNTGGHNRFNLQPGWLLGATQVGFVNVRNNARAGMQQRFVYPRTFPTYSGAYLGKGFLLPLPPCCCSLC